MKKYIETMIKSIPMTKDQNILVQLWGYEEDNKLLTIIEEAFKGLELKVNCVLLTKESFDEWLKQEDMQNEIYGEDSLDDYQVVIDFIKYSPTSLVTFFEGELREKFVGHMRRIFAKFTATKQFLQIRLPSESIARESGLSLENYQKTWGQLVDINYENLKLSAEEILEDLKGKASITLITGQHHLSFDLASRSWHQDVGNGDFPAGEVYIAPIETSANGEFKAKKMIWEGEVFEDILLTFEKGQLVKCSCDKILEDLAHAPGHALRIAEFGIGLNEGIKEVSGYPLFDEKIKGTCHIAIGRNDMFGGNTDNTPVHIDFVAEDYHIM